MCAKGLAFIREPIIASVLGASSSSDGYYLAIGLPFLLYNLFGLPFSLWVTARLAAVGGGSSRNAAMAFYRHSLWGGLAASALVALALVALARGIVHVYASGLEGARLDEAAELAKLGAIALPALVVQAVASGRLFAQHRREPFALTEIGAPGDDRGVVRLLQRAENHANVENAVGDQEDLPGVARPHEGSIGGPSIVRKTGTAIGERDSPNDDSRQRNLPPR